MEGEGRRGLVGCGAGLGVLYWWCRRERGGAALSWRGGRGLQVAAWRVARGEKGVEAWEFGRRRKKGGEEKKKRKKKKKREKGRTENEKLEEEKK
jgi:hypothetical protein